MENFFGIMKQEMYYGKVHRSFEELKQAVIEYIFYYNNERIEAKVVPEGHLFVMGDNRLKSKDSRDIRAIPMEKIKGTTNIVYYPFNEIKIIGE